MTTQVANPIDRLMVLRAQVQATHASDFAAAVTSSDVGKAFADLAVTIEAEATALYQAEVNEAKVQADKITQVIDGFRLHVSSEITKLWQQHLMDNARHLPSKVHGITIAMSRKDDGSWDAGTVVRMLEVKQLATGATKDTATTNTDSNKGGKGEVLSVDGKDYPSAMAAYRELLPVKYAASKNASRDSIGSLLKSAGHVLVGSRASHWK